MNLKSPTLCTKENQQYLYHLEKLRRLLMPISHTTILFWTTTMMCPNRSRSHLSILPSKNDTAVNATS